MRPGKTEITLNQAVKKATEAVALHLVNYTLPANYEAGREYNRQVAENNAEDIARVALQSAYPFIASQALNAAADAILANSTPYSGSTAVVKALRDRAISIENTAKPQTA